MANALAPLYVAPGLGPGLYAPGGDLTITKLSGAQSGNTLSLSEYTAQPGAGPPLHVHEREDETFYVLEGEVTFWIGSRESGKRIVAGPGSMVFGPRGTPHCFKNLGSAPARFVLIVTPPGNFEAFYAKIGGPRADGSVPSEGEMVERIMRHAGEHGIGILGPSPL